MCIDPHSSNGEHALILYQKTATSNSEGQCDCACQIIGYQSHQLSSTALKTAQMGQLQKAKFSTFQLDADHVICYHPPYPLTVLNRLALELFRDLPSQFQRMIVSSDPCRLAIDKFADAGLLIPEAYDIDPKVDAANILTAWFHVTDRCNLRCAYCYLPHMSRDTSLSTGYAIVNSIFRSALNHAYSGLKIKYAGGEPFLRFPFILQIHDYILSHASAENLQIDGIILSNGMLLTGKKVEQMRALGLRLMISMDGIGKFHDCQRPQVNGKGSYTSVANAIEMACSNGLIPHISITVSNRNIDGLADTVAWMLERELPFNINLYRPNQYSHSEENLALDNQRIINGILSAFRVIEHHLPKYSLLNSLLDISNLAIPHQRPCTAGQDYLVFDPDGRVARCQMDMDHTITDCTSCDPLAAIRMAEPELTNPSVDDKSECQECEWRYACAGGCSLQAHRLTGKYQGKSPNCSTYKTLFPEIIRLEGLRLLAQGVS